MLHILLVILKILGIILACLLGLLLLLVLIVLFVPIRYRVDAKKREEVIIKMRVSWLMRIVFIRVWFINKQLHIKLRIFGFTLWDNLRPKKEKKVKKKKVKASKKKRNKKVKASMNTELEKTTSVSLSKEKQELVVEKIETLKEDDRKDQESSDTGSKKVEDLASRLDEKQSEQDNSQKSLIEIAKKDESSSSDSAKATAKKEAGKLKKLITKIKGVFQKVSKLGTTIREKWNKLLDLIKKIFEKKNLVSVFLKDELNKAGIKVALGQLLEVLKHCGPQKIEGYLKFGTGDPESTGKLLGAIAFLYGYYGKSVTIEPDFENKVFEAEGMVKGRIRIIRLLIIGIKVIRDKNFKKLVKNARQLKEEL